MLVPEIKSSQRHPPSPKELGETEVKSREYITLFRASSFLDFSGFERKVIPKLFLGWKSVTSSENQGNTFKSLLILYFIIKQIKKRDRIITLY